MAEKTGSPAGGQKKTSEKFGREEVLEAARSLREEGHRVKSFVRKNGRILCHLLNDLKHELLVHGEFHALSRGALVKRIHDLRESGDLSGLEDLSDGQIVHYLLPVAQQDRFEEKLHGHHQYRETQVKGGASRHHSQEHEANRMALEDFILETKEMCVESLEKDAWDVFRRKMTKAEKAVLDALNLLYFGLADMVRDPAWLNEGHTGKRKFDKVIEGFAGRKTVVLGESDYWEANQVLRVLALEKNKTATTCYRGLLVPSDLVGEIEPGKVLHLGYVSVWSLSLDTSKSYVRALQKVTDEKNVRVILRAKTTRGFNFACQEKEREGGSVLLGGVAQIDNVRLEGFGDDKKHKYVFVEVVPGEKDGDLVSKRLQKVIYEELDSNQTLPSYHRSLFRDSRKAEKSK